MYNKLGNLIQWTGILGVITKFHFYDEVNGIQFDLMGLSMFGILVYWFGIRKQIKVQKSRELDEDKSGNYTFKVQTTKVMRNTILIGGVAGVLLFMSDTIYNLGITLVSCGGVYLLGGTFKIYDTTKKGAI